MLSLTACNVSSNKTETDFILKPVQSYIENDKLYIELLSSRDLKTKSYEVFSNLYCMYNDKQNDIFTTDYGTPNQETISDFYDTRQLIKEKSTSKEFFYKIQMGTAVKGMVFHNNQMSCKATFGKLVGGSSVSNVIQFDMSKIQKHKP